MRAFGWSSVLSLALAACAAPPPSAASREAVPARVVSLNLCTDELLLLLAEPGQIASVSHLAHREPEFPLWEQAQGFPANDGSLANALAFQPDLVMTMGGSGDRGGIAERLGIAVFDLPYPQTLDDVTEAIRTLAARLGRTAQGEAIVVRLEALRRSAPSTARDTLWLGGGGRTVSADGLEAQWMALAGLRQRDGTGGQIELETLLAAPPELLLRSDYRADQYSRAQAWLDHPLASARKAGQTVTTDGRRWTCMGPLLIDEIARLRRKLPG